MDQLCKFWTVLTCCMAAVEVAAVNPLSNQGIFVGLAGLWWFMTPTRWSSLIYNYFGLVLSDFEKIFQSFPEVNRLNLGSVSCFQQLLTQPLLEDQRLILLQSRQGFLNAAPTRIQRANFRRQRNWFLEKKHCLNFGPLKSLNWKCSKQKRDSKVKWLLVPTKVE